jgi:Helix-turn-helix domain
MAQQDSEDLIPDIDLAAELHQQRNTLAAWRHLGKGPAFTKIGRRVFYTRSDIKAWLDAQRREPKAASG